MTTTFRGLCYAGLLAGMSMFASAANTTMTGMISDSGCGASHAKMMAEHKDAKMTEKQCTLACVKAGGKYVFVADGKVYNISNQNLAALQQHAGETVRLTGSVSGDTIQVAKVAKK